MRRLLPLALCAVSLGCGPRRLPVAAPPLFPVTALWTAKLPDFPEGPLAADDRRVMVATRVGTVHAFDRESGAPLWTVEKGGPLGSGPGVIVTRTWEGVVSRLRPRSGEAAWKTETGVRGAFPPVVDGEMVLVVGEGLAAIEVDTGNILWRADGLASTVPVTTRARLLLGETDGSLRCRDRATGVLRWTRPLGSALTAPPLVDAEGRVFVGTTDRRLLSLRLDDGRPGWSWKLGVDVQSAPAAVGETVVVAALDGVLRALKRSNGHEVWRASLPSRPLSAPLVVGGAILVACAESDILGFDARTGARLGGLKTAAAIRSPPLVTDGRIYVGLRDRSLTALALAGLGPAQP